MLFGPKAEILIVVADPVLPVFGSGLRRLFTFLVLYFPPQVDVPDIKDTGIDIRIRCPAGAFQLVGMCGVDMRDRLAVLYVA